MQRVLSSPAARRLTSMISRHEGELDHGLWQHRTLHQTTIRLFSSTSDEGTHDDFKPQYKGDAPASVAELIETDVRKNPVFVYMKGHPEAPMCGFSNMVCRILDAYGVKYGSRDVLADPELREGIKLYTHWPTIPQVFINGEFVGGCDIMMQMHQSGDLKTELDKVSSASTE